MKLFLKISYLIILLMCMEVSAQISTPNGTVNSTTNPSTGNIGIGTSTPSSQLEVAEDVKAKKAIFTGRELENETFQNYDDALNKSIIFSAGKLIPNSSDRRVFTMHDMSMGAPYDFNSVMFYMRDRSGKERFHVNLIEGFGSYSEFTLKDNGQSEIFKVKGNTSESYLQMPKTNTKVIIGGYSNNPIIGNNKLVVIGNSLINGDFSANSFSSYNDDFILQTSGTERLRIDDNTGNLGLNTIPENDTQFCVSTNQKVGIKSVTNHSIDYQFGILSAVNRANTKALSVTLLEGGNYVDTFAVMGDGRVKATEVKVRIPIFPDYVFEKNYDLISLEALQAYINKNKHLPNIPSSDEIVSKGLDLGDMQVKQMEKIEELTLYILEQEKRIKKLESLVQKLLEEENISANN